MCKGNNAKEVFEVSFLYGSDFISYFEFIKWEQSCLGSYRDAIRKYSSSHF